MLLKKKENAAARRGPGAAFDITTTGQPQAAQQRLSAPQSTAAIDRQPWPRPRAADAAAAPPRPCRSSKLAPRSGEDQEALRKKLMLKLYLEGLKTKLKAKGRTGDRRRPPRRQRTAQPGRAHNSWRRDARIRKSCADGYDGTAALFADIDGQRKSSAAGAMREATRDHAERCGRAGLEPGGPQTQEIVARQALRFDLGGE